jgi:HD superfamily phosphodiesterase
LDKAAELEAENQNLKNINKNLESAKNNSDTAKNISDAKALALEAKLAESSSTIKNIGKAGANLAAASVISEGVKKVFNYAFPEANPDSK